MFTALFTALLVATLGSPPVAPPNSATDSAAFAYPLSADFVVLELRLGSPLTPPDDPPAMRLYGDGRVQVHRPAYLRESGDFEAWITPADVDRLLGYLDSEGTLSFDLGEAKRERLAAERDRLATTGSVPGIADATTTHLTIRLERYGPAQSGRSEKAFHHQISWYALDHDAEWYPQLGALQRLHRAVGVLRQLEESAKNAAQRGDTTMPLPLLPTQ